MFYKIIKVFVEQTRGLLKKKEGANTDGASEESAEIVFANYLVHFHPLP